MIRRCSALTPTSHIMASPLSKATAACCSHSQDLLVAHLDIIPQLGCSDGLQEASVGLRNANSSILQKLLGPVKALWGQLVVPKGPQKLTDQDVCLLGGFPVPHVSCHNGHHIFQPACSMCYNLSLYIRKTQGVVLHGTCMLTVMW